MRTERPVLKRMSKPPLHPSPVESANALPSERSSGSVNSIEQSSVSARVAVPPPPRTRLTRWPSTAANSAWLANIRAWLLSMESSRGNRSLRHLDSMSAASGGDDFMHASLLAAGNGCQADELAEGPRLRLTPKHVDRVRRVFASRQAAAPQARR